MGVITTAYSIPPEMMRKIRRKTDLLENIFENARGWKVEQYDFDKSWEETIGIIGNCYPKTRKSLEAQKFWDYPEDPNYEIWTVTPSAVKMVAENLAPATFKELKTRGLELETTDYWGKLIPEGLYSYYVGDIEEFKKFLKKSAAAGNYLLFSTV